MILKWCSTYTQKFDMHHNFDMQCSYLYILKGKSDLICKLLPIFIKKLETKRTGSNPELSIVQLGTRRQTAVAQKVKNQIFKKVSHRTEESEEDDLSLISHLTN